MKLPISWLNEYVSTEGKSVKELADLLLNIGFEVEEIIEIGKGINKVLTGKILDIKKHQEADKLFVCMVDIGTEITTIVTNATNIAAGNIVPVALDGATLPDGKEIKTAPVRGVTSYGMFCSGGTLNIDNAVIEGAEADGILILPNDTHLGQDIKQVLRLNDVVLDVSITANRPDCQSIYGLAREIGAALSRKVKPLNLKYKAVECTLMPLKVKIQDTRLCSRYTAQIIDNVKIERSPDFIRDRLRMVGIRPINNIVDITNYVLTEVGQPLHAFDTRFVTDMTINVRAAAAGEEIVALDGKKYELKDTMAVIADSIKPLAIAGVMGGEHSGVLIDTSKILLESARFYKGNIRSTSRTLGLRSDSSARYEKGVDYLSVDIGRERALALITQLKAGRVTSISAKDEIEKIEEKVIKTSAKQISDLLGITIKQAVIAKILKALEFDVEIKEDILKVRVPLFREDVDNYTDLAEEVIRFYGYSNIVGTLLKTAAPTIGGITPLREKLNHLKNLMIGMGAYEITTYSFINNKVHDQLELPNDSTMRDAIRILNPLSEEYAVMRTQLASNMLNTISLNLNRKNKDFRLFELGRTYIPHALPLKELPIEDDILCVGFSGKNESFYTLKACVREVIEKFTSETFELKYSKLSYYHPGVSADIYINNVAIGSLGKIHPTVLNNFNINEDTFIAEINITKLLATTENKIRFKALPKFPLVERDLAIIVKEEYLIGDIISEIKTTDEMIVDAELFDVYRGEQIEAGKKSVAVSLKLVSNLKTLTDDEIQTIINKVLNNLKEKFEAKLR